MFEPKRWSHSVFSYRRNFLKMTFFGGDSEYPISFYFIRRVWNGTNFPPLTQPGNIHGSYTRMQNFDPLHPLTPGPPLSGGNLRGGGEGDLQDLSGVLEPPGCRTVPGKPILHFPLPSPPIAAKHSSTKTTLPPSAVQGACPVNPSVCLSVCVLHACVCARRKVYTIPEPHLSDLILCKAAHCAGLHSFFFSNTRASSAVLWMRTLTFWRLSPIVAWFSIWLLIIPFTNISGRSYIY